MSDGKVVLEVELDARSLNGRLNSLAASINVNKTNIKQLTKQLSSGEKMSEKQISATTTMLNSQRDALKRNVESYSAIINKMVEYGVASKENLGRTFFANLSNLNMPVYGIEELIDKGKIASDVYDQLGAVMDNLYRKSVQPLSPSNAMQYSTKDIEDYVKSYKTVDELKADELAKTRAIAQAEREAKGQVTGIVGLLGMINPSFTRLSYALRQLSKIGKISFTEVQDKALSLLATMKRVGNANLVDGFDKLKSSSAFRNLAYILNPFNIIRGDSKDSIVGGLGSAVDSIKAKFLDLRDRVVDIGYVMIKNLNFKSLKEAGVKAFTALRQGTKGFKRNLLSVKTLIASIGVGLAGMVVAVKAVVAISKKLLSIAVQGASAIARFYDFDDYFGNVDTMINAYNEFQEKELGLTALMRSRMGATRENVQAIKDLIAAEEKEGVISKQLQTSAMEQLAAYATRTESLETLLPVLNDYVAQMYGVDATESQAESAAKLFGKAIKGQTETLRRAGYVTEAQAKEIKNAADEEQRAALLAKYMGERTANMNEVLAQTDGGKQKQLANTMADVQREFGQAASVLKTTFLPVMTRVLAVMARAASYAAALARSVAKLFGNISKVAAGTVGNIEDVASAAGDAADKAKENMSGLDEMNIYRTDDGAGGGVVDPDVIEDSESAVDDLTSRLDELLASITSAYDAGLKLGTAIREGLDSIPWDNIQNKAKEVSRNIAEFANGVIDSGLIAKMGDTIAEGFNTVTYAIETFVTTFDWHGLGEQWAEGANNVFSGVDFSSLGFTLGASLSGIFDTVSTFIENFNWSDIGRAIADFLVNIDWKTLLGEAVRAIVNIAGVLVTEIPALLSNFITEMVVGIYNSITTYFAEYIDMARASGHSAGWGILQGIKDAFAGIGEWINKYVFVPFNTHFVKSFTTIKDNVIKVFNLMKTMIVSVFNSLWTALKRPINGIITMYETFANSIVRGINVLIGALNNLHIDVPDWVTDLTGMKTFGFNIPTMSSINIPKLATGAVIPPNNEFLAVLGDQTRGTNIEAPADLIRQIIREELGNNQSGGDYRFVAQINRKTIFDEIISEAKMRQMATGVNAFELY